MRIYKPTDIERMTPEQIRSAYSELRRVANKRIANLEKHGYGVKVVMKQYGVELRMGHGQGFRFPSLSKVGAGADLGTLLADVSLWLRDPAHTVYGERRRRKELLQTFRGKYNLSYVNETNLYDFLSYMEELREQYSSKVFDSGDAADVYNEAQRIGIPTNTIKKEFDYFATHLEEMSHLRPVKSERGASMSAIRSKIKKLGQ